MPSMADLQALHEAGLGFIAGSRPVKTPGGLAKHFRWHGNAFTGGQLIDTITPATRPPEPTSRSGPSRSGTQSGIRIRGGPDGTTVTNARSTTAEPSPRRRTKPRPSWPARRQPATHDSCPPPSPTPNHHRHQHQTTDPNPTTPTPSHHPNRRSNHHRSTPHHPDATAIIEKILGH